MVKKLSEIRKLPLYQSGTLQEVYRQKNFVYKIINFSKFDLPPQTITSDINHYFHACLKAGVSVPNYAKVPYLIEGKFIVNKFSFEGLPLFKAMSEGKLESSYEKLLSNLAKGLNHELGMSSLHKQFTFDGEKVVLVDFFVPATKKTFIHYKKGSEAENYFLVQFSKNSVMLSGLTHYQQLFPRQAQRLRICFSKFMSTRKRQFPLVDGVLQLPQFDWYSQNYKSIVNRRFKWASIDKNFKVTCFRSVSQALNRSNGSDLMLNIPRQRLFCLKELKNNFNIFRERYGKS